MATQLSPRKEADRNEVGAIVRRDNQGDHGIEGCRAADVDQTEQHGEDNAQSKSPEWQIRSLVEMAEVF